MLGFVVWNPSPEIIPGLADSFPISPRWYGVLFALGFVFGYKILEKKFKKENVDVKLLDTLFMYVMLGTVLGARLGHVFFYDWAYYSKHLGEILMVWKGGLASHGAAVGIITALYFYAKKVGKSMLWGLDRVVVVVALAACLIRTGNLVNSEIIGKPTQTESGWAFVHTPTDVLSNDMPGIVGAEFAEISDDPARLEMTVHFQPGLQEDVVKGIFEGQVKRLFDSYSPVYEQVEWIESTDNYELIEAGGQFAIKAQVKPVLRYPTQLYEALAYLLIFILLYVLYPKLSLQDGKLFGLFLVLVFGFRVVIEFWKANQVDFEDGMQLNMGQWLSVPLVIVGLYFLLRKRKEA